MNLSPREENISDENVNLRRVIRDLASLSTLSASWSSYDHERIAVGLADTLVEVLSLDLIYIKIAGNHLKRETKIFRCSQLPDGFEEHEEIIRSIDIWLSEPLECTSVIPLPL
jgi:hypothetical protein